MALHLFAIFIVWCVGYLSRPDLVTFLRVAKTRLVEHLGGTCRNNPPESFIFVLDNILDEAEDSYVIKGQRVRSKTELESIFVEAGLIIYKRSAIEKMPGTFRDVCVWALF